MTALEVIAKVKELKNKGPLNMDDYSEFADAAPILARMLEKAIEQRDHYHAVAYRDYTLDAESKSLEKRNAELDSIAEGKE